MLWLTVALAGSNVSIGSMNVDGLEVRDVSCALESFDLMWMLALQKALTVSKAAGDACVPKGAAIRVAWDWKGHATAAPRVVKSSVTPKQQKCLSRVLTLEAAPLDATCELTLLYGEPEAARTAADAL